MNIPETNADIELLRSIDRIADRFEAEWSANRQPKIENYLLESPPAVRTRLLTELLTIELEWRSKHGLPVQLDEYQLRFPDASEVISAVLQEWQKTPPRADSKEETDRQIVSTIISSNPGRSSVPVNRGGTKPDPNPATPEKHPQKIGRYRITKLLGSGAMGDVYLAFDEDLQRQVALKIPKLELGQGGEAAERFQREGQAAATLNHPNICPVYDIGEADGRRYITMAYIEGHSLQQITGTGKPQPERQSALLIRRLAAALQVAHEIGVVHRDLKPANIMLDKKRQPIIMDFGLALLVNREEEARLTHDGAIIGSPAYMSPEQVSGDPNSVGPASDIYTLGVILYELLAGRLPYRGSVLAVLSQIQTVDPPPIATLRPEIDPGLAAIVARMMARSPEERYSSMRDVADDLTRWIKGDPTSKVPEKNSSSIENSLAAIARMEQDRSRKLATHRPSARRKKTLWSGAAILVSLVVLGVLMLPSDPIGKADVTQNQPDAESEKAAEQTNGSISTPAPATRSNETASENDALSETVDLSPPPTALRQTWKSKLADETGRSNPKLFVDFLADGSSFLAAQSSSWHSVEQYSVDDTQLIRKFPHPTTTGYLAACRNRPVLAAVVQQLGGGVRTEIKDLENGRTTPLVPSPREVAEDIQNKQLAVNAAGTRCALALDRFDKKQTLKPGEPPIAARYFDLIVWDVPGNRILWERSLPKGSALNYIRFSPDGRYLLTANAKFDRMSIFGPILLDAETGETIREFGKLTQGSSADAEFLPDSSAIMVAAFNGTFLRISLDTLEVYQEFNWIGPEDGDLHQTGTSPNGVKWFIPQEGLIIEEIELTPDGRYVWTARGDGKVGVWDVQQSKLLKEYHNVYSKPFYFAHHGGMELSPDGRHLLLSGQDGEVIMYEVATESEESSPPTPNNFESTE